MVRFSGRSAILGSCALLLAVGGCSPTAQSMEPIADYPDAISPVINSETGEVSRGSLRFAPSFYDENNLANVVQSARQDCLVAHGYSGDKTRWAPAQAVMLNHSAVGVWRVKDAEEYAFTTPMSPADMLVNGTANATLSGQEQSAVQAEVDSMKSRVAESKQNQDSETFRAADAACAKDPVVTRWQAAVSAESKTFGGPWWDEFDSAEVRAYKDPRVAQIAATFDACIGQAGLAPMFPDTRSYDGTFFMVQGETASSIDEQQITMALAVVNCKTSNDLVTRLMSIVAEYEAPVYVKYQSELDDRAGELATSRAEVSDYWAAHGE